MKRRVDRLIRRAQRTTIFRLLAAYGDSGASNYALALAFAGFMSMFPIMLGALSIIGLVVRNAEAEADVQILLLRVFPASAQPELQQALAGVKQSAGWLGIVSIAGLLWSAGNIYGTLEFALTRIFGTRHRNIVYQRLMGLVMMVLVIAAIVVLVAVNSLAAFLPYGWVTSFVAGAAVMVTLLVALYRFVPNRPIAARQLLPGALLAGVLIELLSLAFPVYARFAGGFNTYGAQFALFFLLATWFYFLSQLILFGAVFIRIRLGERPPTVTEPAPKKLEASSS